MLNFEETDFDISMLIPIGKALAIVIIGYFVIKAVMKTLSVGLKKINLEPMLHKFIIHATEIVLWVVIILAVLSALGIDSTSVVTVLAACGAAVALALQSSLSNLAGGIIIMVNHPFSSGDTIVVNDIEGTVQSIDLFNTCILTPDMRVVLIPNGTVSNTILINNSSSGSRRVEVEIGVSYNCDIDKARDILVQLAKSDELSLDTPQPSCIVWEYADSAIILSLRVFCKAEKYWDLKFSLQNKAKAALDAAGIEIPFPQLDVHLDK